MRMNSKCTREFETREAARVPEETRARAWSPCCRGQAVYDVKSSSNARLTHRLRTSGAEQTGTALLPAEARHGQSEGGGTRGDVPGLHGALKNGRKNENPVKLREKKEIHKR